MTTVMRRGFLSITAVAALSMLAPLAAQAQATSAKHKAVFQVSDAEPQKWNLTLNNAKNVQEELGEGAVEMEIVVWHGLRFVTFDANWPMRVVRGATLEHLVVL